jgi:hypothetical protein
MFSFCKFQSNKYNIKVLFSRILFYPLDMAWHCKEHFLCLIQGKLLLQERELDYCKVWCGFEFPLRKLHCSWKMNSKHPSFHLNLVNTDQFIKKPYFMTFI